MANQHTTKSASTEVRVSTIEATPTVPAVQDGAHDSQEFSVNRSWMSGAKVRCVILSGQDDVSKAPVYVSVNDYDAQFPRDKEVVIPAEAFDALSNGAVYEFLGRSENGDIVTKKIRRFQFEIYERIPAPAPAPAPAAS
jgi:hypothetical protein